MTFFPQKPPEDLLTPEQMLSTYLKLRRELSSMPYAKRVRTRAALQRLRQRLAHELGIPYRIL